MLVSGLSLSTRVDSFLGRQPGGPPLAVFAVQIPRKFRRHDQRLWILEKGSCRFFCGG